MSARPAANALTVLALTLLAAGICRAQPTSAAKEPWTRALEAAASGTCGHGEARSTEARRDRSCAPLGGLTRTEIGDGIAHYSFELRLGPGPFDSIRIHRVVRESVPGWPSAPRDALFLLHGARLGFEATFLSSGEAPGVPPGQALPVFLADNGIDVWAMDSRWLLVPPQVTDLSFMAGWDLRRETDDLGAALGLARLVRGLTGAGLGRLHLLGFSRGAQVAYTYLGEESRIPIPFLRHVEGFIVGDMFVKTDDEGVRQVACEQLAGIEAQIAAGESAADLSFLNLLGELAFSAPDDVSPLIPPLTNSAVVRLFGSDAVPEGVVPYFHQVAGEFAPPADFDLLYTPHAVWTAAFHEGASFMPLAADRDLLATQCEEEDVPWDDHLGDIRVPILYLGAGGGIGEFGLHTLALVGSDDIEIEIVDLEPPELRFRDFGHQDLFLADDAEVLVWTSIRTWIAGH